MGDLRAIAHIRDRKERVDRRERRFDFEEWQQQRRGRSYANLTRIVVLCRLCKCVMKRNRDEHATNNVFHACLYEQQAIDVVFAQCVLFCDHLDCVIASHTGRAEALEFFANFLG